MRIGIQYISLKYYDRKSIMQWVFYFKRYTYVKGFVMRIFGVYINVRERDAYNKLLKIINQEVK
jgi:hypothetical protein